MAFAGVSLVAKEASFSEMQSHLSDLLVSKEGTDITFEVGGQTFAAHRCVLAARSTVFKEQLSGMAKTDDIVEVSDMEPEIFKNLLVFIYTGSFPGRGWTERGEKDEDDEYTTWLLQLLEAADRYDLQRLKSTCAEQLVLYVCRDRVADIIAVAERRQCPWLKDFCMGFIQSYSCVYTVLTAESLDQIMTNCSPDVLKELISKFEPEQLIKIPM